MSALLPNKTRIIDDEHELVGSWMSLYGVPWRQGAMCIGLERHGALVAATQYDWYNGASICGHIVIDGPVTREWLWYISWYPFCQLKCNVVLGLVSGDNHRSRRFVEHFGFKLAVKVEDADPCGPLLLYTLRKEDCRWLRRKHG